MMEQTFELDKKTRIWLYGAGIRGKAIYSGLLSQHYNVEGFIDRNAENIKRIEDKVVVTAEAFSKAEKDAIVIICLQNGLQHESVAQELNSMGVNKILFLPMYMNQPFWVRKKYREAYVSILNNDFSNIKNIPVYDIYTDVEKRIISENNDRVTFWCDIDDLRCHIINKSDSKVLKWENQKIENVTPYLELIKYIHNDKDAKIEQYTEFQGCRTAEEKQRLLEDRKKLFSVYESAIRYEVNFFAESPCICQWTEDGYFHVFDGLHRIFFLKSKGYVRVPIICTRRDFECYTERKDK